MRFFRNRRLPPPTPEDIDAGCRFLFGMSWDEFVDLPEDESDALLRDYLASPDFDQALAFIRDHPARGGGDGGAGREVQT